MYKISKISVITVVILQFILPLFMITYTAFAISNPSIKNEILTMLSSLTPVILGILTIVSIPVFLFTAYKTKVFYKDEGGNRTTTFSDNLAMALSLFVGFNIITKLLNLFIN